MRGMLVHVVLYKQIGYYEFLWASNDTLMTPLHSHRKNLFPPNIYYTLIINQHLEHVDLWDNNCQALRHTSITLSLKVIDEQTFNAFQF